MKPNFIIYNAQFKTLSVEQIKEISEEHCSFINVVKNLYENHHFKYIIFDEPHISTARRNDHIDFKILLIEENNNYLIQNLTFIRDKLNNNTIYLSQKGKLFKDNIFDKFVDKFILKNKINKF
jgi:hypothetical protein